MPDGPAIMILPFTDSDVNASNTMFAEGFSQELTRIMTRYSDFSVISPETSRYWKEQNLSISEIAQKINVVYVVDGTVTREGDMVRIYVSVDDPNNKTQIWSEKYEFRC